MSCRGKMSRFSSIAFGCRLLKPDPACVQGGGVKASSGWGLHHTAPHQLYLCRCLVTAQLLTSRGTSVAVTKPGARIGAS